MAAGLAERRYAEDPSAGPVTITDLAGKPRWVALWQGNPAIGVTDSGPRLACGHGCLPYLLYPKHSDRLTFNPTYRAAVSARARIYLTADERARAREQTAPHEPFILIEPFPADRKNPNRQWPLESWQALVALLPTLQPFGLAQCEHDHATRIDPVVRLWTPSFRDACALMERAALVICLEGGLAFAAAALGVPAVVLWGGAVSMEILSYPEHVNIAGDHNGCGSTKPCDACAASWLAITPDLVAKLAVGVLERQVTQRKVRA